jgi:hypothetical protein
VTRAAVANHALRPAATRSCGVARLRCCRLTFLMKAGGGLYWLIPAVMASLLGGVVNAWLFLVKVTG